MDGENNGKPLLKWMIWGNRLFWETSINIYEPPMQCVETWWEFSPLFGGCLIAMTCMDVSLNGGTPISHPKMMIFSRKNPMVVGETHHFRKPPYTKLPSCMKHLPQTYMMAVLMAVTYMIWSFNECPWCWDNLATQHLGGESPSPARCRLPTC